MATAAEIVRMVADSDYLAAKVRNCFHCEPGSTEHAADCPYRLAREWVAANPAPQE